MVSGRKKGDGPETPSKPENIQHRLTLELTAETDALLREARTLLQDELGERLDDNAFIAALVERALAPSEAGARRRIALTKCEDCNRAW